MPHTHAVEETTEHMHVQETTEHVHTDHIHDTTEHVHVTTEHIHEDGSTHGPDGEHVDETTSSAAIAAVFAPFLYGMMI